MQPKKTAMEEKITKLKEHKNQEKQEETQLNINTKPTEYREKDKSK
jgi:hypothetical protein